MDPYQATGDRFQGRVAYLGTQDGNALFSRELGGSSQGFQIALDNTSDELLHRLSRSSACQNAEVVIVTDWVSDQHYRLIEVKGVQTLEMTFAKRDEGGITLLLRQDGEDDEVQGKKCSFHKYEWLEHLFKTAKLGCLVNVEVIYNGEQTLRNAFLIGVDFFVEADADESELEDVPAGERRVTPVSFPPPHSSNPPPNGLDADLSPAPEAVRPAVPAVPPPSVPPPPKTARPVNSAVPPPPAVLPVVTRPVVGPPPAPRRQAALPRPGGSSAVPAAAPKGPPPLPTAGGDKPTLPSSGTQPAVGTDPTERAFFGEGSKPR